MSSSWAGRSWCNTAAGCESGSRDDTGISGSDGRITFSLADKLWFFALDGLCGTYSHLALPTRMHVLHGLWRSQRALRLRQNVQELAYLLEENDGVAAK